MKKALQSKLKSYSALAGSVALISTQSDAQMVYTDITPDTTAAVNGAFYDLDVDNNGITDFSISLNLTSASGSTTNKVLATPTGTNSIAGSTGVTGAYLYPTAMNPGDSIKASLAFNVGPNQGMVSFYSAGASTSVFGNWSGVTDKYLGLKFMIGTQVHYGWARLDVSLNGTSFTIKDYAYDTIPNMGIEAGELPTSSSGINDLLAQHTMIYGFNRSIYVKILNNASRDGIITVTNVLGQEIANATITDEITTISMENAKQGVYFATVKKADGSFYTKKLFLK